MFVGIDVDVSAIHSGGQTVPRDIAETGLDDKRNSNHSSHRHLGFILLSSAGPFSFLHLLSKYFL